MSVMILVDAIRSSINNARHEILAIRRVWGFAKFLNEEVNELPPPAPAASSPDVCIDEPGDEPAKRRRKA